MTTVTTRCAACSQPGLWCGYGAVAPDPAPCVGCGQPTRVRALCGAARTAVCHGAGGRRAAAAPPDRRGAHPAAVRRADERGERLAADLAALEAGRPLRLLAALEDTHRPIREGVAPYWAPPLPGVYGAVRVVNSWAWSRPWPGPVAVLDRNGAWIAAVSSVVVAHGELVHTGPGEFAGRPGIYEVAVYRWDDAGLPNPLGWVEPGRETVWVPGPVVARLVELHKAGRWPDASVLDSYTGDPVRLTVWADYLKAMRTAALAAGRDSDQYDAFKQAFGQATSLMLGYDEPGHPRRWKCKAHRPDWTHAIQSQAAMTLHRWADDCRQVAPGYPPVGLQNVDELVLPAQAVEIVTTTERPGGKKPLQVDDTGVKLGTFKVKGTAERWGA